MIHTIDLFFATDTNASFYGMPLRFSSVQKYEKREFSDLRSQQSSSASHIPSTGRHFMQLQQKSIKIKLQISSSCHLFTCWGCILSHRCTGHADHSHLHPDYQNLKQIFYILLWIVESWQREGLYWVVHPNLPLHKAGPCYNSLLPHDRSSTATFGKFHCNQGLSSNYIPTLRPQSGGGNFSLLGRHRCLPDASP